MEAKSDKADAIHDGAMTESAGWTPVRIQFMWPENPECFRVRS